MPCLICHRLKNCDILSMSTFLIQQPQLTLTFSMFPAPPHLIEKPQDVQKLIDDSLVWECKATGKPKPSYRWMKNGENLESAEVRSAKRKHVFRN